MAEDVNLLGLILDLKDYATPAMKKFSNSLKIAGRDVDTFAKDFKKMEDQIKSSSEQTSKFMQNMFKQTEATMNKVLKDDHFVNAQLTVQKKAEERYKQWSNMMEEQSAKLHRTIMGSVALSMSGISAMNFSRPILQGFGDMINKAGEYQAALTKIQLTTDNFGKKSGDALAGINSELKKTITMAGQLSPMSNLEVAQGTQTLAQFGFHDSTTLKSLIAPMMQLQAISDGKLDMNQSASLLASLFNKFQINPAETLGTANIGGQSFEGTSMKAMEMVSMMAKAAHDAHMDFDMMSKSLRAAGASMQFTNTSFSEFLAISGSLVKAGYTPAQAGQYQNAISNAAIIATRMRDMTPDAKRAQVASELGVDLNTFKTSDNIIKTLLDIQESAYQKYGSQGAISKLSFLFNTNGMKELQALQNLHQLRQDGKVDMNALEMAADIEKAGSSGYANERMNTLLDTFPMKLKVFQGNLETFGQTVGSVLLPPLGAFLDSMTNIIGKLNEFAEQHPTLTKVLGIGTGLAGLFTFGAGAALLFGGQILSAVASINNFRLQMAMASASERDFMNGFKSAQAIIGEKGILGGGIASITTKLLGLGAAIGVVSLIWTQDIGGLKTMILDWKDRASKSFTDMQGMIKGFEEGSSDSFIRQRTNLKGIAGNWYDFARFMVDATLVFRSVVKYWSTEKIPDDQFKILQDEGLVPVLDTLFKLKHEAKAFFDGFKSGMQGLGSSLSSALGPLIGPLKPLLHMFHLDDLFDSQSGAQEDKFRAIGEGIGKLTKFFTVGLVALIAYKKTLQGLAKIGIGGYKGYQGLKGFAGAFQRDGFSGLKDAVYNGMLKGLAKSKGLVLKTLGPEMIELGQIFAKEMQLAMDRARLRSFANGRYMAGTPGPRTPINMYGSQRRGPHKPGSDNEYRQWWVDTFPNMERTMPVVARKGLSSAEVRELENMQAFATTKVRRDLAARALDAHHTGNLNASMQDIRNAYDREDAKFLRSKKGKGSISFARTAGKGMLRGAGALGSALGIASMFFGDGDITKGGLGSAASGAMTGAGIGMMFGPLGALIGAGIGAAIGGIGTDKIMAGLKTAAQKAGEWWKGFAESNFGGTLIRLFKNGWDNFKQVGWDYIILLKDFFTLNWGALGKDLGKMWTDWYDGFKKQIGVMWDYLKTTDVGKAVCKLLGIETATPNISMSQDLLSGKGARPEVKDTQEGDTVSVNFPKIGNNASGLSYVPYDGYLTKLHKGERVLTDNQARNMDRAQDSSQDSGGGNMSVNFEQGAIQISMANASPAEIERAAQEMFKAFMKKIENKNIANYQPSRARGFVT